MHQLHALHSLWDSLRRQHATGHGPALELHVLISGLRSAAWDATLARRGVTLHAWPDPPIPAWATSWNRGSFCKLHVWNFSHAQRARGRVVYLDTDVVVARPLTPLWSVRTPAIVFWPNMEVINSGVLVLHVRASRGLSHTRIGHALPAQSHIVTRCYTTMDIACVCVRSVLA